MNYDDIPQISNNIPQCSDNLELAFTPIVFPSNDNQNLAVVECKLNRNKASISNFGVATGQEIGSSNPKDILDAARIDSLKNVASMITLKPQELEVDYFPISKHQKQLSPASDDKRKLQGGGNKPISQKQSEFIRGLCKKKHENFDDVAKRVCGKDMSELTGADANAIISELK